MPASPPTRSGNPAKRATVRKASPKPSTLPPAASSISDFKKGSQGELVELPSGKFASIRRIQLTSLISEGLLGDSLAVLAQQAVDKGEGMDSAQIKAMGQDPEKISEALDAFDKIAARCFVEPRVTYYKDPNTGNTIPDEDRDPEKLYSDELDIQDKIFVFQVVSGGTTNLDAFRQQFEQLMAGISDSA